MILNLSAQSEYGLMLLKYLAVLPSGATANLRTIANKFELPVKYLEQVGGKLVKGGIITSRPGKQGGYGMAVNPSRLRLTAILEVLEPSAPTVCRHNGSCCKRQSACPNKTGWLKVQQELYKKLSRYKLADLIAR